MDLLAAEHLAKNLIEEHVPHYSFEWNELKTAIGICSERRLTIFLSKHWVEALDPESVKDTILHEIAHAIAGCDANHGQAWKAACVQLGANPSRCQMVSKEIMNKVPHKYEAVCSCEHVFVAHRLGRHIRCGNYRCNTCHEVLFYKNVETGEVVTEAKK